MEWPIPFGTHIEIEFVCGSAQKEILIFEKDHIMGIRLPAFSAVLMESDQGIERTASGKSKFFSAGNGQVGLSLFSIQDQGWIRGGDLHVRGKNWLVAFFSPADHWTGEIIMQYYWIFCCSQEQGDPYTEKDGKFFDHAGRVPLFHITNPDRAD
jgi:hypothetical protein